MTDKTEQEQLIPDHCHSSVSILERPKESSPAATPSQFCRVAVTPSSPTSNKVSSNGESYSGTGGMSQGSSRLKLLDSSTTPVDAPSGSSRFLYVKEKFRRPSFLSDISMRSFKDGKSNPRMGNLKKDLSLNLFSEPIPPSVPPNTPSPSGWRNNESALELFGNKIKNQHNANSICDSDLSSHVTTKALASESESNTSKAKASTDTLSKGEKVRPSLPLDCNFDSNYSLNWSDQLSYKKKHRPGHASLRTLGSSSYLKSIWNNKGQKSAQHHCFMSDITDVRQMEHALLQLLEDFHSGKLKAFTKDCSMEQMQGIREQQERLARLHFDLYSQQDLFAPLSNEGIHANQENMQKLMDSLEQLSLSIEKLQLFSKDVNQ